MVAAVGKLTQVETVSCVDTNGYQGISHHEIRKHAPIFQGLKLESPIQHSAVTGRPAWKAAWEGLAQRAGNLPDVPPTRRSFSVEVRHALHLTLCTLDDRITIIRQAVLKGYLATKRMKYPGLPQKIRHNQ